MKEKMLNKYIVMLMSLLFILSCVIGCGKKEEDYRQIQVYKIDGTAMVARQGSSMDAYENMQLQSGDVIETIEESYLQLKLDEDKYILIEPESKISLQATGNSVDSKTSIYLEKGAIVNQLDNPLSEDSSYEITTPNSTMAVRGTTFRVEITVDEKGESHAKVAVYDGKVECNLVFPDGTIAEPVIVEKGIEVLIWGDDTQTEYVGTGNISYKEMKTVVIDFLREIIDRGKELSVTKEELGEIKQAIEMLENEMTEEEENEEEPAGEEENTEEVTDGEDTEDGTIETEESETVEEASMNTTKREAEEEKNKQPAAQQKPSNSSGGSTGGNTGGSTGENTGGSTGGSTTEPEPAQTRKVTVNFVVKYGEGETYVFATKTTEGIPATETAIGIRKPVLVPGDASITGCWVDGETSVWEEVSEENRKEPYFGTETEKNYSIAVGTEDVIITLYWWAGDIPQ